MNRRIISSAVAIMMVGTFLYGCGPKGDNNSNMTQGGTTTGSQTGTGQGVAESGLSTTVETLNVYMPLVGGGNTEDLQLVVDAVNEYIEPLIYANINLKYVSWSQWKDQMNMSIASGEQVDLMNTVSEISGYYKNGALLPLDDLITRYGSGIKEYVDDIYLGSCTFRGELYGVPTLRDMAKQQGIEYNANIAEEYGLEMKESMTLDEVEEQFYKLREANPDITCLLGTNGKRAFDSWCGWDGAGDIYGVVMMGDTDPTLINLFESEEYRNLVKRMETWYNNGIIYKDAPTSDPQWSDLASTGTLFARVCRSKPGYEEQETQRYGNGVAKLNVTNIMDPIADSSQAQFVTWAIPTSSKYPEKAMAFMNLLYTDPHVINLLSYGVEGVHYVVTNEADGMIDYPDGVDASTSNYAAGMNYAVGNELIGYLWEGNSTTLWDETIKFNQSAQASPLLGFTYDNSNVANEVTACNNVVAKYAISLELGCVEVDTILPEFQKALRDAGIEKIIEEKQKQVDEWYQGNQ